MISPVFANDVAPQAAQGSLMSTIIMFALFGLIFYFFIVRPQSKRMKEHQSLMGSLTVGSEVLTSGGVVGKIIKITAEEPMVVVALNKANHIVIKKDFITAVLPEGSVDFEKLESPK